jgi:hypothetical protein
MSTSAAFLTVLAVLAFSLPAAYWQIRRAMAAGESTRDRLIREAHEHAATAAVLDPATLARADDADRALIAGCQRLLTAVHEHRKENH